MKPARDPAYLALIRQLPCVVGSVCYGAVEAAHTGPHGMGQKSSDYSTVPLCVTHHRLGDLSLHKLGPGKFSAVHGIDLYRLANWLSFSPEVRVIDGKFVATIHGQERYLGPVDNGLETALRALKGMWVETVDLKYFRPNFQVVTGDSFSREWDDYGVWFFTMLDAKNYAIHQRGEMVTVVILDRSGKRLDW
jgi:hypothetical protein